MEGPILVPVDGSEPARRALGFAISLSKASGRPLEVVTVIDAIHYDAGHPAGLAFYKDVEVFLKEGATKILDEVEPQLKESGITFSSKVLWGPVLRSLLEECKQSEASQLVVGRTGKGFFGRIMEGSISRGLATHAEVPSTIVP